MFNNFKKRKNNEFEGKDEINKKNTQKLENMVQELLCVNNDLSKKNNEILKKNELLLTKLEQYEQQNNQISLLKRQLDDSKKYNEEIFESYNLQLSSLFLFFDLKAKSFLKYNHMLNQELLDFTVNVCNKYGLDYWVDWGNLLGAVRHKGFIPWDDDLDIGMIRKDYNVLLEVINDEVQNNNLSNDLKISINISEYKILPILQLLYTAGIPGTILAGIDVFPYDFIGDVSNYNPQSYDDMQKSVFNKNREGTPMDLALTEYFDTFDVSLEMKQNVVPGIESLFFPSQFRIFETDKVFPLKTIEFENKLYKAPHNPDYYLTKVYGDYLEIPQLIYHHHIRFKSLRRREDGEEFYKEQILKMKKVNENFE